MTLAGYSCGKLTIQCVQRLPRQPEDLPQGVVEIYIHASIGRVDMSIVRHGFVASTRAAQAIASRIQQLVTTTVESNRPIAERIDLTPMLSADWYQFLDNLLQQADSWAFLAPPTNTVRPC